MDQAPTSLHWCLPDCLPFAWQTPRSLLETDQQLDPVLLSSPAAFFERTVSAPARVWAAKPFAPLLPNGSIGLLQNLPLGDAEDLARCTSNSPSDNSINALTRSTSYRSLSNCLWMNAEGGRFAHTPGDLSRSVSSDYGVVFSAQSSLEFYDPCGNEGVFHVDNSWAGVPVPLLCHDRK